MSSRLLTSVPENQRPELHDTDKPAQVHDLGVGVATVHDSREVEELGSLVDFLPEPRLEGLLLGSKGSSLLDEIEMSEDSDDFGESVSLEDVEELEGFLEHGGSDDEG